MVWRLTFYSEGERRGWNCIYATRKEALEFGRELEKQGYKRLPASQLSKVEFCIADSETYAIAKIDYFYDGA